MIDKKTQFIVAIALVSFIVIITNLVFAAGEIIPITSTSYTPSTETHCINNICTQTIYSGIRFVYEDNVWKKVEDAKSLKNVWGKKYLEKDADFDINIVEVNYSYIELAFLFNSLNFAKYSECTGSSTKDIKCDFKLTIKENVWNDISQEFDKIETKFQYKYQEKNDVKIDLKFTQKGNPFGKEYTFGGNSTTITLNESNLGNIEDSYVMSQNPTNCYGISTFLDITSSSSIPRTTRIFILWNLSTIPMGSIIINANLSLNITTAPSSSRYYLAYNTSPYNTTGNISWNEGNINAALCGSGIYCNLDHNITWNNQPFCTDVNCAAPSGDILQDNVSTGIIANVRKYWNITNATIFSFNAGRNMSIIIRDNNESDASVQGQFGSKESTSITNRPQLMITYEEGISTPTQNNITYSNNITTYPANYNGTLTIFNVTIGTNTTDGLSYNRSLLEINYTGALVNYTMNRFPGNVSNYNLTLGIGTYRYREIFNNSAGNYNTTGYSIFTIDKGTAIPLLLINPTSPITYNTSSNASCYDNNTEQQFFLYRDYANVSDTENNTLIILPAGTWNYECNATATENYTSVATSQNYVVNKLYVATHIAINGTEADKTYYYGNTTNVTAWNDTEITDSFLDLYKDDVIVSNPDIQTLEIGVYNYATYPNSSNYTSNATRKLTIISFPAPPPTETKVTFGISCDPFWVNFEIIAGFVLGWIGLCLFYILVKKLPDVTRPIIWFILILAMLVLLFSTPYPTDCFTQAQIDFISILIIISIMVSVALGVFSVRG